MSLGTGSCGKKKIWQKPPLEPSCLLVAPGKLLQEELRLVVLQAASSWECLHTGRGWGRKSPFTEGTTRESSIL